MKFYADKLKIMREIQGLTQKDIAEKLKCTPQAVERWENGKNRPRPATVTKLAKILGCSVSDISDLKVDIRQQEKEQENIHRFQAQLYDRLPLNLQELLGFALLQYLQEREAENENWQLEISGVEEVPKFAKCLADVFPQLAYRENGGKPFTCAVTGREECPLDGKDLLASLVRDVMTLNKADLLKAYLIIEEQLNKKNREGGAGGLEGNTKSA